MLNLRQSSEIVVGSIWNVFLQRRLTWFQMIWEEGVDRLMLLISIPLRKNPWMVSSWGRLSKDWAARSFFPEGDALCGCHGNGPPHPRDKGLCSWSPNSLLEFSHDSRIWEMQPNNTSFIWISPLWPWKVEVRVWSLYLGPSVNYFLMKTEIFLC